MTELTISKVCIREGGGMKCRTVPANMLNRRPHWSVVNRWKNAWKEETHIAMLQAKVKPGQHKRIRIILKTVQPMDKDNMYASVKPIVDQLTGGKDSQKDIELEVVNEKVAHRPEEGTVIQLA